MAADIPLCRSGGLDLDVVRRRWGLDTCLPVDPLRWKPFQPTHPEYLSAVAIQVLSEGEGCLKFIEPTVSTQTLVQRQTRQVVLGIVALLRLTCLRVIEMFAQCLEADTPLPSMCRRARQSLRRRAPRIKIGWDDLLNFMILCCWLFLAVGSVGGYFQIAPRERARNWARTGSLSL
ncbi:hypothetical protein B0H10DRAFT_2013595 [Mycena sp. CBHHK59/15]|nr:hypothetical protein B0H10DRAFT_2013595 [Mycena sp. CBHHK59/15]